MHIWQRETHGSKLHKKVNWVDDHGFHAALLQGLGKMFQGCIQQLDVDRLRGILEQLNASHRGNGTPGLSHGTQRELLLAMRNKINARGRSSSGAVRHAKVDRMMSARLQRSGESKKRIEVTGYGEGDETNLHACS